MGCGPQVTLRGRRGDDVREINVMDLEWATVVTPAWNGPLPGGERQLFTN